MFDKNGAVLNNGDDVIVHFTVVSVDNEGKLILETKDSDSNGSHTPIIVPPDYAIKYIPQIQPVQVEEPEL